MNAKLRKQRCFLLCIAATTLFGSVAVADPIVGRDMLKFSQKPMDGTTIVTPNGNTQRFWGHDELSTAYSTVTATGQSPYVGRFMADDFADKLTSPVVHVKWWGSYLNNFTSNTFPVDKFLISFESDVPATAAGGFSHPGQPLLSQVVRRGPILPGSGTFTEKAISPGGPPLGETLYEYNAELNLGKEFLEKQDTVYWLKIVAMVDVPPGVNVPDPSQPPTFLPRWGWHNRDYTINDPLASTSPAVSPGEFLNGTIGPAPGGAPIWHFQDDAVTGLVSIDTMSTPMGAVMPIVTQTNMSPTHYLPLADGPQIIVEYSKDLAFELYTVKIPEPATCALMLLGMVVGIMHRRPTR